MVGQIGRDWLAVARSEQGQERLPAKAVPWYLPRLVALLYSRRAGVRAGARRLLGWLGARDEVTAAAVVRELLPVVYEGLPATRRDGLAALAAITARRPAALSVPTWGWWVQALDATQADPALTFIVRRMLARRPARPVSEAPTREAAIWAELARSA